eukprot:656621-Rhodomonas_salina.1
MNGGRAGINGVKASIYGGRASIYGGRVSLYGGRIRARGGRPAEMTLRQKVRAETDSKAMLCDRPRLPLSAVDPAMPRSQDGTGVSTRGLGWYQHQRAGSESVPQGWGGTVCCVPLSRSM